MVNCNVYVFVLPYLATHDNNANSKAIRITFLNGSYSIVQNTKCILLWGKRLRRESDTQPT